ncbi:MAG: endonuclease MutS2 [Lachnospiraceae bacterium]|jgi:DNA mismatch repair protein MutS2|nr:endonuclease MutS2 [Lachnospiraceae bacterium]
MNEKSLRILEYNKIIEMLSSKAHSKAGKLLCDGLKPIDNLNEVISSLQNTDDALKRLLRNGNISFAGNKDIRQSLLRLKKGSSLNALELLLICDLLEASSRVKSYLKKEHPDDEDDSLDKYYAMLEPLTKHSLEIRRCIISEDEIADDASSELKAIRRHIKGTNDKIHSELTRMVNTTYRTYLQDAVITMRDGRYCIPVKAEYKSNVPGMVHDQSGSQSTFFIEPAAIVNLNNELKQLSIDEEREVGVILAKLSSDLSDHLDEIMTDSEVLTILDFIFAKANLALDMNATRPLYNVFGHVNLKKARHPLLDKNKVVPIDIKLGYDFDLLIITGPNTGGKTVALKTIGLLSLMGQAGLFIPAKDASELSIFDNIYADIGDEQSIEQSLSTFSSHMKNIVEILHEADEKSLCLFDELGAGTDPIEGAALAISVLSDLHARKVRSVATTHYSELKVYALQEEGVENACCEFDVDTLRPTYRLLIGIAGKSNAFAISSKLGLPSYIIDDAKSRISKKDESFEDVLTELENNRVIIENEKAEIEKLKREIELLKKDYENRQKKLLESKDKIIREATEEAREILQDAKNTADTAIRDLMKKENRGDIRSMERNRTKLREKIDNTNSKVSINSSTVNKKKNKPSDFKLGEDVRIISLNMEGTINSLPDSKGNLYVLCGIMRMQAKMDDIEFIDKPDIIVKDMKFKSGDLSKKSHQKSLSKASSISMEINLLGKMVDEAIAELDKYLDDAYLSHLSSVRIVHGKGTGALRNAVHNYLKNVSYVSSYRLAEYGEGDAGVTIVEFK